MHLRRLIIGAAVAVATLLPVNARAVEPSQAFLDGLRERGYFDLAIEYLDAAAASRAISPQFKETLLYEKGVTLVQGARYQRDPALREQQLDEAQKILRQFIDSHGSHLLAIAARSQLGNVIVERARNQVEKAKKLSGAEKQNLHKQARAQYEEGAKVFTALVDELREKLKAYPAALDEKKDARRIEERDRYRQDFLQGQLLAAAAREEMADALDKGSKDWIATLTTAADGYKKVYENYRTRLAGLYARMYQGRCLQKLAKHKEASALFTELLANPDSPEAFRTLKLKVMALAADSWLAQELNLEVLERAVPLVESARPSEDKTDEMMSLRVSIAKACKAYASQLKAKNARDPQIKRLLDDGRKYVTYVTRFPGEYQELARKLLPDFSAGEVELTQRKEPQNFAEAHAAAKESIDAMQSAGLLVKSLPSRVAAALSSERQELQKQLDEAKQQTAKHQADAMRYCRQALQFADKETDPGDLNLVRYLICYLLFSEANYHDAVVMGEFVARKFGDSPAARACAKIAMASYLKLYGESAEDDREFESRRIISIADYIVKKWPDQPEAAEALNTLIPFMIRDKRLQEAQDYLAKIPVDSTQRGTAELKTGQALWAAYQEGSQQIRGWENGSQPPPEGLDLAARKRELDQLKSKARQTLVDGVERMRSGGEMSQVLATALLSLAQIHVDTNEPAKAVALLEDPKIGPLALVKEDDPIAQREGFAEETYKAALRAYISSLAGAKDGAAIIQKARGIMASLKQDIGSTPEGQQKLVSIYVSLARDLQRQMEIADPTVKQSLGLGFETFLRQVAADATELNVLNWVAETYRGMGESFAGVPNSPAPQSRDYFAKAAETYQKILEQGRSDAGFLSPAMANQIRIQLAKTKKSMDDFEGARTLYESILKENPMLLPAQSEAARLYQDWATAKRLPENYRKAMLGDRANPTTGKNVIWGWGQIANMTAGNAQFKEQFYEARYNLALCRYYYAMAQQDPTKQKDELQKAKRDITLTAGFYPELGGEKWKSQYDTLLKTVQKALGESQQGLAGLQNATASTAGGTPKTVPTSASSSVKKE
jgi:hypothetical protein